MKAASGRARTILLWFVIAACSVGAGGFLFAWSGIYNVAASSGHWAVTEMLLRFGMRNSIDLRANAVPPPPRLDNHDLIQLGAAHYERGCAFCHGSPDRAGKRVTDAMLPSPPVLKEQLNSWTAEELFWIVRHGIKYTGMPGWLALERTDEVWTVVAFLRKLPELDATQYRTLALGAGERQAGIPVSDRRQRLVEGCAGCHGDRDAPPRSALVPRLHGQPQAFLANALRNYADGTRPSGLMQPVAAELDPSDFDDLAKYYADLKPIPPGGAVADVEVTERGRSLATRGDAARRVPACVACHQPGAREAFPILDGQSAAYMARQLLLWRSGHNHSSDGGAIMAPIARRLTDGDIDAVARYFASRLPGTSSAAQP